MDRCLLFIAAQPREFSGLLTHVRDARPLPWPVHWAREGDLHQERVVMVANGVGPDRAARALQAAHADCKPRAVISAGFCGALDPSYRIADIFVATTVQWETDQIATAEPQTRRPCARGRLLSVDRIVGSAQEKSALHGAGASAVEMEAAGLAPLVREWELPFFCIRSVTDLASEGFGVDLNFARLPDGRLSTARILGQALRRPIGLFPELIRLRKQCILAARSLGDFIADCRF